MRSRAVESAKVGWDNGGARDLLSSLSLQFSAGQEWHKIPLARQMRRRGGGGAAEERSSLKDDDRYGEEVLTTVFRPQWWVELWGYLLPTAPPPPPAPTSPSLQPSNKAASKTASMTITPTMPQPLWVQPASEDERAYFSAILPPSWPSSFFLSSSIPSSEVVAAGDLDAALKLRFGYSCNGGDSSSAEHGVGGHGGRAAAASSAGDKQEIVIPLFNAQKQALTAVHLMLLHSDEDASPAAKNVDVTIPNIRVVSAEYSSPGIEGGGDSKKIIKMTVSSNVDPYFVWRRSLWRPFQGSIFAFITAESIFYAGIAAGLVFVFSIFVLLIIGITALASRLQLYFCCVSSSSGNLPQLRASRNDEAAAIIKHCQEDAV